MDTRKIRKLIELVKETGIGELEVTSENESVRISCQTTCAPAPQQQVFTQAAPAPAPQAAPVIKPTEEKHKHIEGHQLKSPMVGTVYLAPTPGSKPFVNVGQRIDVGDTLCIIEAMKMFNKIEADTAGIISARVVENEQPVEYDQPLFIIATDE